MYIYDKALTFRIYKEALQLNKKTKKSIKLWAEDLNRFFTKRRYMNGR